MAGPGLGLERSWATLGSDYELRASLGLGSRSSPLGEVLSNLTDYKGTGEISLEGSISWSFDPVKRVAVELKPREPSGRR
jgi:hypothetical protein